MFGQSIPITSSACKEARQKRVTAPTFSSRSPRANFFLKSTFVLGEGLCTLIMVKYCPGAARTPSDLPQTNFAAYWFTVLVCPEVCGIPGADNKAIMRRESVNPSVTNLRMVSLLGFARDDFPG